MTRNNAGLRRALIVGELRENGHVSVVRLSQTFGVSEMTVRRDLRQLSDERLATLVHGGARLTADRPPAFTARAVLNASAKHRIGAKVCELLAGATTIGLDGGTTALEVAQQLPLNFRGTAVSHSLPVLMTLTLLEGSHNIGVGGDVYADNQSMVSAQGLEMISHMRFDAVVLGANGIDSLGAYVHSAREMQVKHAYMQAATRVILAVDATKWASSAPIRFSTLGQITDLVTDQLPPTPFLQAARQDQCDIVVV